MIGPGTGKFKGPRPCNWCKEKGGHLIKNCPKLREDRRLQRVCRCRPIPHLRTDCPESRGASRTPGSRSAPSSPPTTMAPRYGAPRARKAADPLITAPKGADDDKTPIYKAFHDEERPNATFRFPHGFDAFKSASDNATFDAIAKAAGCTLTPEAVGDIMGVKIFGNKDQCADAISQLRAWSAARDKALRTKKVTFPTSFNQVKHDHNREKAALAESRKKFRADCDTSAFEGKKFAHAIILEYKRCEWMNGKILGTYMEALDPIRMDHKCHITYMLNLPIPESKNGNGEGLRNSQGFFLCGNKKSRMDQAVERLKNLDKQINARNIDAPQFFLVKPGAFPLDYNAHVIYHKNYPSPQLLGCKSDKGDHTMHLMDASGSEPNFLSANESDVRSIMELNKGAILIGSKHLASLNVQYINVWLTTMLERLRCWQGYLEMRISIGTCAFETYVYNTDEYSLRYFEEMVEERNAQADGIEAYLTTELGDLETESALLDRFLGAGQILMCRDHMPGRELYPQCTAIFQMKSPWNSTETLRLKAVFKENGYGDYLLDTHQWELLESGQDNAKKMVDIKIVDLKHSYTSTGIALGAGKFVTESQKAKLPSWSLYERFLQKISVISENAKPDVKDRHMFEFEDKNGKSGVHILSLEQRKSYIFEILIGPGRGYHVELFSFQMAGARKTIHFPQNELRWAVQLWHPSWDALFYEHQVLEIGMRADWEPAEWQFFPPCSDDINDWQDVVGMEFEVGSGYQNMLDAVNVVENIIRAGGEATPFPPPKKRKIDNGPTKGKNGGYNLSMPIRNRKDNSGPVAEKKDMAGDQTEKRQPGRERRPDQLVYRTFASAVAQGKPTGAAVDLAGLEIEDSALPVAQGGPAGAFTLDLAGSETEHSAAAIAQDRPTSAVDDLADLDMEDFAPPVAPGDPTGAFPLDLAGSKTEQSAPAIAQTKPTSAVDDLAGLEIPYVPIDKSKLDGAAKDLADLWM